MAKEPWYRRLQRRAELHLPAALLVGTLFRHHSYYETLPEQREKRCQASALAQKRRSRCCATRLNPQFHVQHAERDLDADPRRAGKVANQAIGGCRTSCAYTLDQTR